jgi:outer membrane immunogenic protein
MVAAPVKQTLSRRARSAALQRPRLRCAVHRLQGSPNCRRVRLDVGLLGECHLKKLRLASAAVVLVVNPAFAADLPTRKTPPAPVVAPVSSFSWTGCYVGGHVGGGWGQKDLTNFSEPVLGAASPVADISGWLGGGQIGCNYQFATNWVAGIEVADSWANIRGTSDPFFGGKAVFNAQTNWIASGTARLGYAWDRWLIYARGGAAWAGDKYNVSGTFAGTPYDLQGSETRSGWTIGGGVEWAFWQNWSANLEYAYYDFGNRSLLLNSFFGESLPANVRQNVQTVTLGVNYHF